jgi:hypothetical protein
MSAEDGTVDLKKLLEDAMSGVSERNDELTGLLKKAQAVEVCPQPAADAQRTQQQQQQQAANAAGEVEPTTPPAPTTLPAPTTPPPGGEGGGGLPPPGDQGGRGPPPPPPMPGAGGEPCAPGQTTTDVVPCTSRVPAGPPVPPGPPPMPGAGGEPCAPGQTTTDVVPCTSQVPAGPPVPPVPHVPPGTAASRVGPAAPNKKGKKGQQGGGGDLLAAIRGHTTVVTATTDAATWETRRARAEALSKKVTSATPVGVSSNQIDMYRSINAAYDQLSKLIRTEFPKDTPERTAHWATTEKAYAVFLRDTLFGLDGRQPSEQFGRGVSAKDVNTLEQYAKSYLERTPVVKPVAAPVAAKGSMMEQMLAMQANLGKKKPRSTGTRTGQGSAAPDINKNSAVDENLDSNVGGVGQATQGSQQELTAEQQAEAKPEAVEKAAAIQQVKKAAAIKKVKFADILSDRDGLKKRVEAIYDKLGKADKKAVYGTLVTVKARPTSPKMEKDFDLAYMRFMFTSLRALKVEGTTDWKEPTDTMTPAAIAAYMDKIKTTSEEFMATKTDAQGGASDDDDEEDDDDVEGGSDTDEQEEDDGSGGKPLVLYEPSVRRVLMSMLLKDERASEATCADRFCIRDFSRCRLPCCPADRRLLGQCAEAELRELVHLLHPLLRRAY